MKRRLINMIDQATGLKWERTGGKKPTEGRELTDKPKLAEALMSKTQFSQEEWKRFDIKDLRYDHFIQSRGAFFEPLSSFIRSGNTYLRPLSKYFQSVAYFRPADQAKSIGDDASNYIEIDDKYYYIEIDDKYFQVRAVTNANQAARNLVPTASYSGEGACVNVWWCYSVCVCLRVLAHDTCVRATPRRRQNMLGHANVCIMIASLRVQHISLVFECSTACTRPFNGNVMSYYHLWVVTRLAAVC